MRTSGTIEPIRGGKQMAAFKPNRVCDFPWCETVLFSVTTPTQAAGNIGKRSPSNAGQFPRLNGVAFVRSNISAGSASAAHADDRRSGIQD